MEQYVRPELLVLVPVLCLVGMVVKHTEAICDKWIPLILGGVGVVLAVAYLLLWPNELVAGQAVLSGAIQGILCAGLSVYGNQVTKQLGKV